MPAIRPPRLALRLLLLPLVVAALLAACAEPEEPEAATDPEDAATAAPASPTATPYEVRGEVVEVPDPDDPMSAFYVRHEAIEDFRDMGGEVVGMDSMTMSFPLAESVDLAGVEAGDPVLFTLLVDWEGDVPVQITTVRELPEGTELDFAEPADAGPMDTAAPDAGSEAAASEG